MKIVQRLLKYFNQCRCWIISLFSNDPYLTRIKSLSRKIEHLQKKGLAAPTPIPFPSEFIIDKSNLDIEIFQPNISNDNHSNLVKLLRARLQLCNMVGDYIGDYYVAVKKHDKKKAKSIYDQISAIEADRLDEKASKKLKDFMSKNKQ